MKDREDLYKSYSLESNRGIFGFILSAGHKKLERQYQRLVTSSKSEPLKILEIGGARNPHYQWIDKELNVGEYCIEDVDVLKIENGRFATTIQKVGFWTDDSSQESSFDRIIVCHVWEHILMPEKVLEKWLRMLTPNGVISILLPNDPAILWGIARRGYFLKLRKQGWTDLREYKYALSLEHVNSIQNLIRISEYFGINFDVNITMWPLGGTIISANMQTIVSLKKAL